jgi:hypothetical protein
VTREHGVWLCPVCHGSSEATAEYCPWCGAEFVQGKELKPRKSSEKLIVTWAPIEPATMEPSESGMAFHKAFHDVKTIYLPKYNKVMLVMMLALLWMMFFPPAIVQYFDILYPQRVIILLITWCITPLIMFVFWHEYQLRARQDLIGKRPKLVLYDIDSRRKNVVGDVLHGQAGDAR